MKVFKTLALSALVLAALPVDAQTVIRITASNGDRTATQNAIFNLLKPGASRTYRGNGVNGFGTQSQAAASNFGVWRGYFPANADSIPANEVIIKVSFSGALAGIAAVAGNIDQRFVASNGLATDAPENGSLPNPLTSQNQAEYEVAKTDFGFSTNFQSTSPFNGNFQGVTYSPVIEEIVGISPLGFYASPGFPGTPSNPRPGYVPNITTALARQLYETGSVRLAQFTGDWTNDRNKIVYAIGRNTDAGQRFGALLEVGFSTSSQVTVWFPTFTTPQTTVSGITFGGVVGSHELWPIATQPGTFAVPLGSGGYNSGANLAAVLTSTLGANAYKGRYFNTDSQQNEELYPDATEGYYVGYITPGDANNRVLGASGIVPEANRGVSLNYNGVPLTTDNVKTGTYTAWLYNRILKPQNGLEGAKLTFADALRDQVATVDAPSGGGLFNDATVQVERFTDGGLVVPK